MESRIFLHALKVGLSFILLCIVYSFTPDLFSTWKDFCLVSLMTVTGLMELSLGATLKKCANNVVGTGIGACVGYATYSIGHQLNSTGEKLFMVAFFFNFAIIVVVTHFVDGVKDQFESGISTLFSTVASASLSTLNFDGLSKQLIKTRLLGSLIAVSICLFITICFPVLARVELHNHVAEYLEKLAFYYEGLEAVFWDGEFQNLEGQSFLESYKPVMNSNDNSMLMFVIWEPFPGPFRFPSLQYKKIGDLCRELATTYSHPLSSSLLAFSKNPRLVTSWKQNTLLRKACLEMCSESAYALRSVSLSLKNKTSPCTSIKKRLSRAVNLANQVEDAEPLKRHVSYILSMIIESVEKIIRLVDSFHELAQVAGYHRPVSFVDPVISKEGKEQLDHVVNPLTRQCPVKPLNRPVNPAEPVHGPISKEEKEHIDHVVIHIDPIILPEPNNTVIPSKPDQDRVLKEELSECEKEKENENRDQIDEVEEDSSKLETIKELLHFLLLLRLIVSKTYRFYFQRNLIV